MPLAGYEPPARLIPLGDKKSGKSFEVHGLSLTHVAVLIREHFPDLDAVFAMFNHFDEVTPDQFQPLVLSIVSQAPGFAANVIAIAAGEGDAKDAMKLPAPLQVKALMDIAELTFMEVGGVKKGWEMVADLLKGNALIKKAQEKMTPA